MSDEHDWGVIELHCMAIATWCVATTSALAQTSTVPVRPLGKIVAQATDTLRSVNGIRQLSDGHVFAQDGSGRRVLLFDSTLTKYTVVIDSGGSPIRQFGPRSRAPLFAYAGDTTLFFDVGSTPFKPLASTPGTVYDVVNRKGELIDRVQIPPSLNVVGFGPGVVYMTSREGAGVVLLRARIR